MRISTTTVARFWLDQQGSALIEGAAMVPLLILFFAGVFEFSWFLYQQHLVTIGLHDAASYLARSLNPCNPTSRSWKAELEQAKNLATTGSVSGDVARVQGWTAASRPAIYRAALLCVRTARAPMPTTRQISR